MPGKDESIDSSAVSAVALGAQLAWATDAHYVPHVAASLHSAGSVDPGIAAHLLLAADVTAAQEHHLERVARDVAVELVVHRFEATAYAHLPVMDRIGSVMWFRVGMADLLPTVDRILYLDADTIVRRSVASLFTSDLDGCTIGAVHNVTHPTGRDLAAELGLPATQRYFNSGVLLMDLRRMRETESAARIERVAAERELVWPDQDALNMVLGGSRKALHPRWNCQNSFFYWESWAVEVFGESDLAEATEDPAILHFEGPGARNKPWDPDCRHPYRAAYLEHASSAGFPAAIGRRETRRFRLARRFRRRWSRS